MTADERRALAGFVLTVTRFMQDNQRLPVEGVERVRWEEAPLRGLRMAAADMVEWCQDLRAEQVAALDADLTSRNLPTLTQMRGNHYRRVLAILARDRIRSEAEWQALNALVADTSDNSLSPDERSRAERLVATFRRANSS